MNIINVNINGMEYNLRGEESEEYLHKVARYVDKKLKAIIEGNSKLSVASAAVLTALNVADEMFKYDIAYEEVVERMDKLSENEKSLKEELNTLRKQLEYLEDYNSELQTKLNNETEIDAIKAKEIEVKKMDKELQLTQESAKEYLAEAKALRTENKELKFQLQSYKYKTMDLQNKLIEKGIDLAKEKKMKNPLISLE
ncbi:cell division protein ZapA [Clostridium sp. YIM B02515]|uniref:Cell division protein ZapA n=1 Tax=Clostridium rhizosphaerae TaxID=2803861 RepID=A0ABS1TFM0_9CLOT|nr:cell division protein ZapA [Clostridium rhizosphaerae]MBL4938161.1 cell division protein ZapA [Clostridium rhizosphaerae]